MNDSSKKIILRNVPILNNASDKFKEASKLKMYLTRYLKTCVDIYLNL